MKKLGDLRNILGNLEPEGQGCDIIMEVTHLHSTSPWAILLHSSLLGAIRL